MVICSSCSEGRGLSVCVFAVANVSFDTTEEQLGTVLREVGPIVSLKWVGHLSSMELSVIAEHQISLINFYSNYGQKG